MIPYQGKTTSTNHNVSSQSLVSKSLEIIFSLILIVVLFAVLSYLMIGMLVPFAPVKLGGIIGSTYLNSFHNQLEKVNPEAEQRMQKIFSDLKHSLPEANDLSLVIVPNPDLKNAFALPGGIIVFGTGLIDALKNDREIAMIMAHEIGHQVNRDPLRMLSKGALLILLYSSLSVTGEDLPAAQTINTLVDLSFSRKQELKADSFALELLDKTYHSTEGAVEAFQSLLQIEQKASPKRSKTANLNILKTHPDTEYRIKELERKIRN